MLMLVECGAGVCREGNPSSRGSLGDLVSQEPFIAWLRCGIGRDRIFVEPKLYEPLGAAELIREQSREVFSDQVLERRLSSICSANSFFSRRFAYQDGIGFERGNSSMTHHPHARACSPLRL